MTFDITHLGKKTGWKKNVYFWKKKDLLNPFSFHSSCLTSCSAMPSWIKSGCFFKPFTTCFVCWRPRPGVPKVSYCNINVIVISTEYYIIIAISDRKLTDPPPWVAFVPTESNIGWRYAPQKRCGKVTKTKLLRSIYPVTNSPWCHHGMALLLL